MWRTVIKQVKNSEVHENFKISMQSKNQKKFTLKRVKLTEKKTFKQIIYLYVYARVDRIINSTTFMDSINYTKNAIEFIGY